MEIFREGEIAKSLWVDTEVPEIPLAILTISLTSLRPVLLVHERKAICYPAQQLLVSKLTLDVHSLRALCRNL